MRRVALFACLAALASAPVIAQDGSEPAGGRSAADAQRFLAQLLVRTPGIWLDYNVYRNGPRISPEGFAGAKVVPASGEIVGVENPDICTTRFALEQAQIAQLEAGESSNFFLAPGKSASDFIVDWSKAGAVNLERTSKVTRRDANGQLIETLTLYPVIITMENGWQEMKLDLPSSDERARLSLAIDVLKNSCRFQTDTGF